MKNQHFSTILEYMRHLENTEFRGSGRTTRMLNKLSDGDAIAVIDTQDQDYYIGLFFIQNKKIKVFVAGNKDTLIQTKENWERNNPNNNFHLCHRVITTLVEAELFTLMERLQ